MAHYVRDDVVVGHGPTAREISHLATLFDEVRHIACIHTGVAPAIMMPYDTERLKLVPVPPTGGVTLLEKLNILRFIPLYVRVILRELRDADVVHVRCPANISLIAILLLALVRKPRRRWIKYAGNWKPDGREAWSYTFQRWWLRHDFARAQVTVNGEWPAQPPHIHSFLNPCLTDEELVSASGVANNKQIASAVRLIFVGRLEDAKGVHLTLNIAAQLRQKGVTFHFDLVGDGPSRSAYEQQAAALGLTDSVTFHGWLARTAITPLYDSAHFLLFPSSSEGWPKVISEAMAAGVVPITSDVSSIPQYLRRFGCGRAIAADDIDSFVEAILWYIDHPKEWVKESRNGASAARLFSYSHYLKAVQSLLSLA